jgi:hypothetical protein
VIPLNKGTKFFEYYKSQLMNGEAAGANIPPKLDKILMQLSIKSSQQ